MPVNEHLNLGTVMFSTPVSSQKVSRGGLMKLKSTRFALPSSGDVRAHKNHFSDSAPLRYVKMAVSIYIL